MIEITDDAIDRTAYERDGFVVLQVLDEQEIDHFLAEAEKLITPDASTARAATGSSDQAFQHFGDRLEDYGKLPKNYYFHLINNRRARSLHNAFHHPNVLQVIEAMLGPELILNNGSMLAAEAGVTYHLGWHRDVIQIPQEEIEDFLYSPEWFHNNVQVNLALTEDRCLWAVPGSHCRPNNAEEITAFGGSKHYAPPNAEMPGAVEVPLKPGEGIFYNNNMIHNGLCQRIANPRRTIHLGYHTDTHKPSWHFYLLDADKIDEQFLDGVSPELKEMMIRYRRCRERYPRMEDTWKREWAWQGDA
jgi:ectoine hydroxylase-related dioxygenase (phytanoyl-CoA dioxygenase family)